MCDFLKEASLPAPHQFLGASDSPKAFDVDSWIAFQDSLPRSIHGAAQALRDYFATGQQLEASSSLSQRMRLALGL